MKNPYFVLGKFYFSLNKKANVTYVIQGQVGVQSSFIGVNCPTPNERCDLGERHLSVQIIFTSQRDHEN